MKKEDLRTRRTKKMILTAFMQLVEQKGFEQITVSDIANEAMINRATFYAHFKDKQDVYDYIFNQAFESFISVLAPIQIGHANRLQLQSIQIILTNAYEKIHQNRDFFKIILNANGTNYLREKLVPLLHITYAQIFEKLEVHENDFIVPTDFIIEYMTSTFITSLYWWIHQDSAFTPKQMAQLTIKLVGSNHLKVLGIAIDN
ncbi:TetR/AcrR family transcriptional regulator [Enterococcus columbae]|uniref:HTH tetR-type domain-containing protein n=1 Tax=Enterococcus columbae DSM 7374 = ATCC 51263 TaxID=1121865 RepID=S1NEQ4_9ENTE|nr:TetR/AcrR family transcriptional regulator [Enterococcus columbae]EOT44597.1 hypothetical protein OMW_00653 [Enterococcus columbae DSM 7374 = ATCC 51263]EOW87507.1 hypothetical protein I568_00551 [Enterococcus columbae DSM 7374 = ATCC 51263]OJG25163.1 hypothetical protein RR47_GL001951 [Enterococcus columbae DSM 7374 = ATCC 51263]